MWRLMDLFLRKNHLKMLGLSFSSKLDCDSYIISIDKTGFKKIRALIRSIKFLAPEVTLYLYKSTIRPSIEHCFHVRSGAPSCYLEMLNKPQKRVCRTVGPTVAASFEPLAHRQNITLYSNRLHDFSVPIFRCYKDVYGNSFFPRTAKLQCYALKSF